MMGMIRALTISLVVFIPALAGAAVVQVESEAQLIQRSDAVVMGTIIGVNAAIQPKGGIITTAQLRVFRTLRGVGPGEVISIVVPGGVLKNGLTSMVAGAPNPRVGDWALVLLEKKSNLWTPQGLSLGWIELKGSPESGFLAFRELDGLSLVGGAGQSVSKEIFRLRAIELDVLWKRMETEVNPLALPQAGEVNQ
jgi:hypothetical protein